MPYHEERMNRARKELFGYSKPLLLSPLISIPPNLDDRIYKCRIVYKEKIEHSEFIPYQQKTIRSLKLVYADNIDYSHKFENREMINELFAQRGECDDILIIKNGFVTDTSYCNIIFYDGNRWITPSTPLLQGTQRQKFLDEKVIHEQKVLVDDLNKFIYAKLVNSLLGFEGPSIPLSRVK